MKYKTRGIVLAYLKYGETSIIVKILTEKFGLQSYIINGVRSAKSKGKLALYQPLTLLDLIVYHKGDGKLSRVAEVACAYPYKQIPFDFRKSGMTMFISEMLERCVREEASNPDMFDFLFDSFCVFDRMDDGFENFHIQLLLKFTFHLGILPDSSTEFYREGGAGHSLEEERALIDFLLEANFDDYRPAPLSLRRAILRHVIDYYRSHIDSVGEIKSLHVLTEIMR